MIPLIAALLPLLPSLIQGVEHLFGGGTGSVKFGTVQSFLEQAVEASIVAGKLPADTPKDLIPALIEVVVQQLKASGQLGNAPQTPGTTTVPSQPLPPGTSLLGTLTFTSGALYGAKLISQQS